MSEKKPNPITYECSECHLPKDRSDLLAKRIVFTTIKPVNTVRSRVVGWICTPCRALDPAWNAPKYASSPGGQQQGGGL